MDQLKGSLRFVSLPALTQFIVGLGTRGSLKLSQGVWSGEITLRDGQIIDAQLGTERGRAALESMVLALTEAEFAFLDGVVDSDAEPIVGRDELGRFLAALVAERERLLVTAGALNGVPRLIDICPEGSQVTVPAGAWQLVPMLVHGHTLEQIALRRGLARTLRELARLREAGLVQTIEPGRATETPAAMTTPADVPAPRPVPAVSRPLRAVSAEGRGIPVAAPRHATWWQSSSGLATAPVQPAVEAQASRSWRRSVRGFFIAETSAPNT